MAANPLIIPILEILKSSDKTLGEYDLISQLEEQGFVYPVENDSYNISIFKKHFMTMNALYHLQKELMEDGYYLTVSALSVKIEAIHPSTENKTLIDDGELKVRDYYLDWRHFDGTTETDIRELLSGFWKKYYAFDKQADALDALGLDTGADWQEIQKQYRRLAAEHHPDKGGDNSRFIEIREAYEILRFVYS